MLQALRHAGAGRRLGLHAAALIARFYRFTFGHTDDAADNTRPL